MSYTESELEAIYHRAREIQAPDKLAAYLAEACADRHDLRQRVEELLEAGGKLGSFMEQGAAAVVDLNSDQPVTEAPGTRIGPYKLLEEIGEGGFGVVFVAEQHEPLRRRVALKMIKPGMDSREVIARFEAERQVLALLDHPNIARVLDAGTTDSGRPFFVMELVRGVRITDYCDDAKLTPRERLDLFAELCRAVQHAHQKGIIHRDIKPSNVLVTLHDGRPLVKIIDFGVAKALDQQLSEHTVYTRFRQMIGTPIYMSPEQTGMSSLDIDTRSDIYSLGVLLYELLTGSTPFDRERLARGALEEIQRIIREEEPPKPSTKLSDSGDRLASIAAMRQTEPARLAKLMRGDLDWIVMKCLEKDRNRRYDTATSLVRDIERYLHDEPVEASPPSAIYRLNKFVRRHQIKIATLATLLVILVAGSAIATWQAIRATRSEQLARQSAQRTEHVLEFLISAFRKPDPSVEGREVKVADVLEQAIKDATTNLEDDPLQQAAILDAIGETLHALGIYDEAIEAHKTALNIVRAQLGDEHPDTVDGMQGLALGYQAAGELDKALPLLEKTLELARAKLGNDHPGTLSSMNNLASGYQAAGELGKALPLLEKTLELARAKLGNDHPGTLSSMNNLASGYQASGELDKALPLLEKTLELARGKLGNDHPDTLTSMNSLAHGYMAGGELGKALPLLEQTLERRRTKLGDDHPETLASMNYLARGYKAAGELDKALPLLEQTLAAFLTP